MALCSARIRMMTYWTRLVSREDRTMGINKGGGTFIDVANGWLNYGKKDAEGHRQQCRSITGFVRNIAIEEDEYEKQKRLVCRVFLEDPDAANTDEKQMQLKFTLLSWYGQGFGARLKRIDFKRLLTIGASGAEGGNEKVSFCWMKQDGIAIPADKENWPMPQKVTVSGKLMTDWGPMAKHFSDTLDELRAANVAGDGQKKDDDLPF